MMNRALLAVSAALVLSSAACSSKKQETPPVVKTSAPAEVSVHTKLVNAVHNYDKLDLDPRLELVNALIEKGADVNTENELGEPILGDAVHFGEGKSDDIRVVKALVEAGAKVNAVSKLTHRSPLTKAAEAGNLEAIQYFFEHGLEINNENGTRAVVKAAFLKHNDVVDLFLARGFQPTGEYADALQGKGMKSEETNAAAALFGAYVDIAKEELLPLLRDRSLERNAMMNAQLGRIQASCSMINSADAINDNLDQHFNRPEECSEMGRLGSLAYMHCYGLLRSNSANLEMLQAQITAAAKTARDPLKFENVKFAEVASSAELLGYDQTIRASMALYQDLLLPRMRAVASRMSHHTGRNRQLQDQARKCGNRTMIAGATEISSSLGTIRADQDRQVQSYQAEMAVLEKMRAKIAYEIPALSSTEVLRQQEAEIARKKAEQEKEKSEEPTKS